MPASACPAAARACMHVAKHIHRREGVHTVGQACPVRMANGTGDNAARHAWLVAFAPFASHMQDMPAAADHSAALQD